jgi:RimJ/RimL family protein N-acetyltransferase
VIAKDLLTLRLLSGEPQDVAAVQDVLEAAPQYAQLITGAAPAASEAADTFTLLPPGKTCDDKFVLGVFLNEQMIGCVDLIRGYPDASTAFIGLLVIAEPFQERGLGSAAYRRLEQWVRDRDVCERIRLAVVGVNEPGMAFWEGVGFAPTGETTPYRHGRVTSELVLFEKPLAPSASDEAAGGACPRLSGRTHADA